MGDGRGPRCRFFQQAELPRGLLPWHDLLYPSDPTALKAESIEMERNLLEPHWCPGANRRESLLFPDAAWYIKTSIS